MNSMLLPWCAGYRALMAVPPGGWTPPYWVGSSHLIPGAASAAGALVEFDKHEQANALCHFVKSGEC